MGRNCEITARICGKEMMYLILVGCVQVLKTLGHRKVSVKCAGTRLYDMYIIWNIRIIGVFLWGVYVQERWKAILKVLRGAKQNLKIDSPDG